MVGARLREFFVGVRGRLLLLVVLAVLPSAGLFVVNAWEQRRAARDEAQKSMVSTAQIVTAMQGRIVDSAHRLLITMAAVPSVRGDDAVTCQDFLRELVAQDDRYANLGVIRLDGTLACSAVPVPPGTSLADRDYFTEAVATRDFTIGDYQTGRISGEPSINFGQPVFDTRGAVNRVVFAAVRIQWLNALVAQTDLPPGAELIVVDRRGQILIRHPGGDPAVGAWVRNTGLFERLTRKRGVGLVTDVINGDPTLVAYGVLEAPESGVAAIVGITLAEHRAYLDVNSQLRRNLVALGGVLVLVLIGTWVFAKVSLLRPGYAVLRTARRLARGDLSARTGVRAPRGEIEQLSVVIDEMAANLERQHAELGVTERIRNEMEIAREVQASLLPATCPPLPGHEIVATCDEANAVGGDYFDFVALPDGRLALVMADVSGHGVSSALVMASLRSMLKSEFRTARTPGDVLDVANAMLAQDLGPSGMFVTVFLGFYHPGTGALEYSSAGHPPPILIDADGHSPPPMMAGGVPLGIFAGQTYDVGAVTVTPGSVLVIYTDGVTEARNAAGHLFGVEALTDVVREHRKRPAEQLQAEILWATSIHARGRPLDDDATLIVLSRA